MLIDIRDITKVYEMGAQKVRALDGVSLQVDRGEYVAIMGPSGSGKSTLMNLIGCLDTPTSGSYVLNGREVARMTDDELAAIRNQEIGFVFQTFNLLPRTTALQQVELPLVYSGLPRKDRRDRAIKALEAVGLGDRMMHHPSELSLPSRASPDSFLIKVISVPGSMLRKWTSSMKARIRKMPRPDCFNRFSGARGSGMSSGSSPLPSSRMVTVRVSLVVSNLINTFLRGS
jgi:ABC-type uncharacterized transport system YnjBCD ATPase subunit